MTTTPPDAAALAEQIDPFEIGYCWQSMLHGQTLEDARAVGRTLGCSLFDPIRAEIDAAEKELGFNPFQSSDLGICEAKRIIRRALELAALRAKPASEVVKRTDCPNCDMPHSRDGCCHNPYCCDPVPNPRTRPATTESDGLLQEFRDLTGLEPSEEAVRALAQTPAIEAAALERAAKVADGFADAAQADRTTPYSIATYAKTIAAAIRALGAAK